MASVLALSGFLNSFKHSWASLRLKQIIDPNSDYTMKYLRMDSTNAQGEKKAVSNIKNTNSTKEYIDDKYKSLYDAFIHSYVENTFTIRVPFFGINFDVNDLGLLGGLAFCVILFLFRYSLARELENLTLSFAAIQNENELQIFYHLLAMRQVLTIPPRPDNENVKRLNFMPKILLFFPLFVHMVVTLYDSHTMYIGFQISPVHSIFNFVFNLLFWVLILMLTLECMKVWKKIDQMWADNFHKITRRSS
jgi:hypothetical protein